MASADTGEREMETYRTEQPGGSATVAAGPGDDDVEQMRQQILRAPTATEKAKADEDRTKTGGASMPRPTGRKSQPASSAWPRSAKTTSA
jgi:hypothetical protein